MLVQMLVQMGAANAGGNAMPASDGCRLRSPRWCNRLATNHGTCVWHLHVHAAARRAGRMPRRQAHSHPAVCTCERPNAPGRSVWHVTDRATACLALLAWPCLPGLAWPCLPSLVSCRPRCSLDHRSDATHRLMYTRHGTGACSVLYDQAEPERQRWHVRGHVEWCPYSCSIPGAAQMAAQISQ